MVVYPINPIIYRVYTTWDVWNPKNHGIKLPTSTGFRRISAINYVSIRFVRVIFPPFGKAARRSSEEARAKQSQAGGWFTIPADGAEVKENWAKKSRISIPYIIGRISYH